MQGKNTKMPTAHRWLAQQALCKNNSWSTCLSVLPLQTVEERVEQRLQAMSEAERKLEQLQKEKERVRNTNAWSRLKLTFLYSPL